MGTVHTLKAALPALGAAALVDMISAAYSRNMRRARDGLNKKQARGYACYVVLTLVDDINFRNLQRRRRERGALACAFLLESCSVMLRRHGESFNHRPFHLIAVLLTTTLTRHLPSHSSRPIIHISERPTHLRIHIRPHHDPSLHSRVTPKPPPPCPAPRVRVGRSIRRSLPTTSPKRRRSLPCPMRISKSSRHTAPLPMPPPSRSSRRRSRTVRQVSTRRSVSRYHHSPLSTHIPIHTHVLAGVRHRSRPSASLGYCRR